MVGRGLSGRAPLAAQMRLEAVLQWSKICLCCNTE